MAGRNYNRTVFANAQRLLNRANNRAFPAAMAAPPTAAQSAGHATTIASGIHIEVTDQAFSYLGTDPIQKMGPTYNMIFPAQMRSTSAAANPAKGDYYFGNYYKVMFGCDADVVEILSYDSPGASFRIWVDGVPMTVGGVKPSTTAWAAWKYKLTFASAAPRIFVIELSRGMEFGGINVGPNYGVWKEGSEPFRTVFVGDSYADGSASDQVGYATSYVDSMGPETLRRIVGFDGDGWLCACGGLGYLKVPPSFPAGGIPRAKIPYDVTPYDPDWILVALGINDNDTVAVLQAEVTAYYQDLLAQNPNAVVTVIGPFRAPTLNPGQARMDAIKAGVAAQAAAVASKRIMYFDTFAETWQDIAGRVGAVSGAGNSNLYIGPDGTHPSQDGVNYLSRLCAGAAIRHAQAILASA